jgi:hypothetical protein
MPADAMLYSQPKTKEVKGRWGRIRRRTLWPHLGKEEMTELKYLTPDVALAFVEAVGSGAISSRQPNQLNDKDPLFIRGLAAKQYLSYCAICIRAFAAHEDRRSNVEIYRGWADGRHGGLLDLPPSSARAFSAWLIGSEHHGSHPFEFFRDRMCLYVNPRVIGAKGRVVWLRLMNRKRFVSPDLVVASVALHLAGVPIYVDDAHNHAIFAVGDDYVGIVEDRIWEIGSPQWPVDAGILNTLSDSFLLSDLRQFPTVMRQIEWFPGTKVTVKVG